MELVTTALRDQNRVTARRPSKVGSAAVAQEAALEGGPDWPELVHRVRERHQLVTLTEAGRPSVVLLPFDDFRGLEETIEILSDPETMRRLADSEAELERGEIVTGEELAEAMQNRKSSSQ